MIVCVAVGLACAEDAPFDEGMDGGGPVDAAADAAGSAQLPPSEGAALDAWLSEGHYLAWRCEAASHPARPPGAHGANRICSNELLAMAPPGPFPAGAAAVKELYRGGNLVGHAVALKTQADSEGGNGWYWYEKIGTSVVADGAGVRLCAGCHEDAGPDFASTARDHVFTVVP